ncbi:MAG: hypothetical protein JHC33_01225 [Ignisphaera sp.]|nr:hypothetical protein [Ignisphaera sp.]
MFEERKVEKSGIYAQEKLEELTPEVGASIGFYLVDTPMITGDDGQFMVCNGLQVNLNAKTVDDLVATATPVSFIPKSILQTDIEEGNWNIGQVARLESHIRKGDTYKGKKVKYFHWNIFIQNVPNDVIKQLKAKIDELEGKLPTEAAKTDTTQAVNRPKL